jgi:uncharacterized protein YndB with AHSA1/START domain
VTTAATATVLLEFRTELGAPPEHVFAALTEGPRLARWFCDEAESTPSAGGRLTLRWNRPGASAQAFEGRWVVFEKPMSCAYDGGHSGYPDGYAGRVGFELAAGGPGTVLITRHRLPQRLDYEPIAESYRGAWPRALARLGGYLAAAA